MPVIVKILLGLLIAAAILTAVYALLYIRAQLIRKRRRAEAERRRREMLRRQAIPLPPYHEGQPYPTLTPNGKQPQFRQPSARPVQQQGRPAAPAWPQNTKVEYRQGDGPVARPPREGWPNPSLTPNGQIQSNTQVFSTNQIKRIDRDK